MRQESRLPRLTIDTNNVVSVNLTPANYASHLLNAWRTGKFHWIMTEKTFHELEVVLNRERFRIKYGFQPGDIAQLLETISSGVQMVTALPIERLPIHSRDPKDDKFLACAIAGNCDYLVTEYEDLLVLNGKPELGKFRSQPPTSF